MSLKILEEMQKRMDAGSAISLINDDNGEWAFASDGTQSLRISPPDPLHTCFYIEGKMFRPTIQEAWEVYLESEKEIES